MTQPVIRLLDDGEIAKLEEGVGVGAEHGTDQAVFHQIVQVVGAQRAIAHEEIAHRVVLTLQHLGCRNAGELAELGFAQNPNAARPQRVQFFRALELLALVTARGGGSRGGIVLGPTAIGGQIPKSLVSHDEHRRLRADVVGRNAAEPGDERARILAPERAELSGKDHDLPGERPTAIEVRRG